MSSRKPRYFSGIISAIIICLSTFSIISIYFGKDVTDWMGALETHEWFAWILAITIFLVPVISGVVCGHKGCSFIVSLSITFLVEFLAIIVAFIIGFVAALLSLVFGNITGIVVIVSLFIAFTATPGIIIILVE